MRLNRYIASANGMSRRAADDAIGDGRLRVNGKPGLLGQNVEASDSVTLDGEPITLPVAHTYVIFNKPISHVTSRVQQGDTPTIYALLPPELHRLRSVGRLDRDSSGLLVLTDDGDYAFRQTHPSFQKEKRYEVGLSSPLTPADAAKLRHGVALADGVSRLGLDDVNGCNVTVRLSEGRNRQIRRSFGALGYEVVRLHRTHFGALVLGDLQPGEWRSFVPVTDNGDHA